MVSTGDIMTFCASVQKEPQRYIYLAFIHWVITYVDDRTRVGLGGPKTETSKAKKAVLQKPE